LLGFANTFPVDELVSLPGTRNAALDAEGVADDVEALDALVVVDEEEVAGLGAAGRGAVGLAATGREDDAVG
jgi:hypothetical protein